MYEHAHKLFDEMPNLKCQRTVYAFNALLEACVRAEKYDTMRELFQELPEELSIEHDVVSYNTLIKALCKSGSLDFAISVMDEMENQGIKPDKVTFNTLLKAYHECKKFSEAEDLWVLMQKKNIVADLWSYNIRLRGLVANNQVNEAIGLFEEMGKKDIIPNALSYNTIIKMFVGDRNLEEAKRWNEKMAENERYPDNATFGMLIHFACDKDDLDFVLDLCKKSMDSKVTVHNATMQRIVDDLVQHSKLEVAKELVNLAKSYKRFRRSGNYKPSIWEDGYVQSRATFYAQEEKHFERAAGLKEEVRRMLGKTIDPFEQLELVDILQRLGLSYHFEEEIDRVLKQMYVNIYTTNRNDGQKSEDLYATALEFRLLRREGYHVPQEMFCTFMNKEGKFKTSLVVDTKGLLSLYEACYLSMEGESILEIARDFATNYLTESLKKKIDENLTEQVSHALEMPLHWRMQRLEARWFIEVYHKRENMNPLLLELAKLDYNMVQATYLEELKEMSRWDKNIKLVKKMSFVRDRLVEGFLWAVGFTPNPQFGYCRKFSTKMSVLLTAIDDIYDVYGTMDELELFTDIVDRWDINAIERLPDYMKICFLALFNSMNELAYDILKEQGFSIISHIRKQWANLCKAYLLEVKWYQSRYTPSLNEFLRNAWITNTGPVLIMHAYFCITNPIKEEELECLKNYPAIIQSPSLILRLANDLATSPDEIKKGDYLKSIHCYMHESGRSEENARNYIKKLIDQTWKKMNKDILRGSSFSKDFRTAAMNLARIAQCMYQHGDGFGIPDRETKDRICSLFFEPIPLS